MREEERRAYQLGKMSIKESRERGLLGGLQDHGAAGGQGRANLGEEHGAGEVPGDDVAHNANWFEQSVGVELPCHLQYLSVDFVSSAGVVTQSVGYLRNVHRLTPMV